MAASNLAKNCLFCKIIRGEIPCHKLAETDKALAFLDINPLSAGHTVCGALYALVFQHEWRRGLTGIRFRRVHRAPATQLVIPKYHGEKVVDVPDEFLTDILPVARKVAIALGAENFNILQNNGALAHQVLWRAPRELLNAVPVLVQPLTHCPAAAFPVHASVAQVVPHVHFHVIPKTSEADGLGVGWPAQETDHTKLKELTEKIRGKM